MPEQGVSHERKNMKLIESKTDEYRAYVDKNDDPYSAAVVQYTERWASLMESALASGEKLEDVAAKLSHQADTDGITGFMYGCAVSALAHFWEHGEDLRRWHNLKTQIGNEGEKANASGGTLNPALLNIEV